MSQVRLWRTAREFQAGQKGGAMGAGAGPSALALPDVDLVDGNAYCCAILCIVSFCLPLAYERRLRV